jgi:hypothetical protein
MATIIQIILGTVAMTLQLLAVFNVLSNDIYIFVTLILWIIINIEIHKPKEDNA